MDEKQREQEEWENWYVEVIAEKFTVDEAALLRDVIIEHTEAFLDALDTFIKLSEGDDADE